MTNEEIKSELIDRVNNYLSENTNRDNTLSGLNSRLTDSIKSIEKIKEILKEILKEKSIDFKDEKSENDFIEFIKPTMFDLAKKTVQN